MTLTAPPADIAIIGGGLAGLTLALALHQLHLPCTVYEARMERYDQGGGLMLSPNGLRVLDAVGAYERLRGKALEFDKLHFVDDENVTTDTYYFGSRSLYGYEAMRIMRRELLRELLQLVRQRQIPIHFDCKLAAITPQDVDDRVVFSFANGREASASLVVGADGIQSAVRRALFPGVTPQYAGILGISSIVQRSQLRIPPGFGLPAIAVCKPGGFLIVPQTPDGSEVFVGAPRRFAGLDEAGWAALRADKERLRDMVRETKDEWSDPVQSALEAMPVERMGMWAFHSLPALPSWLSASNRVVLVGDAAHAIPPTVGQGANQALEDVLSLAHVLASISPDVPLDQAAALWQAYRQARVDRILALTAQMNAKRLPKKDRDLLPPGAVWTDSSALGQGGELEWLYNVDMGEEAGKWVQQIRQGSAT